RLVALVKGLLSLLLCFGDHRRGRGRARLRRHLIVIARSFLSFDLERVFGNLAIAISEGVRHRREDTRITGPWRRALERRLRARRTRSPGLPRASPTRRAARRREASARRRHRRGRGVGNVPPRRVGYGARRRHLRARSSLLRDRRRRAIVRRVE